MSQPSTGLSSKQLDALRAIRPKMTLLIDPAECWAYGSDNSKEHAPPAAVALPTCHEQVLALTRLANAFQTPLTARGRGTGTAGGAVPIASGIVVSFERMNQIIAIQPEDRYMVVEAGVTNAEVQAAAKSVGFFWPPDPTSAAFCTVSGNLACNAAGPRAVKYGTPRENTLGLKFVSGAGQTVETGVYTSKGVVGYDLTRLLIGSEGTLGLITEARLKLTPLPEGRRTMRAFYRSVSSAAQAVSQIMTQPVTPCALEFIDHAALAAIRRYSNLTLPDDAGAMLMIEVDGAQDSLSAAVEIMQRASQNKGLIELSLAHSDSEIETLWATRKALSPSLRKIAPVKINEDVVVPVSRLAELISQLDQISEKFGIPIVNFGHAGNGNIHVNLLINPDNTKQASQSSACLQAVFDTVLSLQGTLSGEHGIGLSKREFVGQEIGPEALQLMTRIKQVFDPKGILNPGKKLPDIT